MKRNWALQVDDGPGPLFLRIGKAITDAIKRGRIAFNDNVTFDPTDFFRSTADLKVVDLSRPGTQPTTLQAQAYLAFLPTRRGRELAFTTGSGPQGPGLYVAKAQAQHGDDD